LLASHQSAFQPTYFLINSSAAVIAKLAYQNGGGYLNCGLPAVSLNGSEAKFSYLFKDLVTAVNKGTNLPTGTQTGGIYSQTGVNVATVDFSSNIVTTEIGNALNMTGGFHWMYDGYLPVEQNFFLYPESVEAVPHGGGNVGQMSPQQYNWQALYEWSDNQGNIYRSAPSLPAPLTLSSGTSAALVNVPYLPITYKIANSAKLVLFRWSTAQQNYYQTTSIAVPIKNDPTQDYITVPDTNSDAAILGNALIYTTGGVLEDISAPAARSMTAFDSRLVMISSEDPNLLLFSKPVVEGEPVEMSDLLSIFVPPTTAAQGSTGPMFTLSTMDDKLIIGKKNAFYFINGTGPDSTGANSQYSQPIFITSTIGCTNQRSIVFIPAGLMFQSGSGNGIWLLGRDLSTSYIGAEVEEFNSFDVLSAINIPGTTQVRFTMSDGTTLMYDYFRNQWATFTGVPAVSSCIYQNLHTFINSSGQAFQETPDIYLDGSSAVTMSFTTGSFNFAGLQGYQRAYRMYLLGIYQSPHKLVVGMSYDNDPAITQQAIITPDNNNLSWGIGSTWGSQSVWGGPSQVEQWQINFQRQQCQSFQVSVSEIFDPRVGPPAGAGLTVSGMNLVIGRKKGYPRNIGAGNKTG